MKGLQGERLRQAFKYLDTNMDGFILPDQFKRIILVCRSLFAQKTSFITQEHLTDWSRYLLYY